MRDTGIYARAFTVAGRPNQMTAYHLKQSVLTHMGYLWVETNTNDKLVYRFMDLPLIQLEARGQYPHNPSCRLTTQHVRTLISCNRLTHEQIAEFTVAALLGEIPDESALLPVKGSTDTDTDTED